MNGIQHISGTDFIQHLMENVGHLHCPLMFYGPLKVGCTLHNKLQKMQLHVYSIHTTTFLLQRFYEWVMISTMTLLQKCLQFCV